MFGISKRKLPKNSKTVQKIKIQGGVLGIEGGHPQLDPQSLLFWSVDQGQIPGTINAYTTYDSQVTETYRKYNGQAAYGAAECRTIVDLRSSFIAGEGINISCKDETTAKWIEKFLNDTRLDGAVLTETVKASEMAGQLIMMLKSDFDDEDNVVIKLGKRVYTDLSKFRIKYVDKDFPDEILGIEMLINGIWKPMELDNFVYIRTGGDDSNTRGPTTKVGLVLNELENYDRAIKDIRRNNYVSARATPYFKAENQEKADALTRKLKAEQWTIGKAFVAAGVDFSFVTPGTGASENLLKEIETSVKTISGTTGVPVHWVGFVDLMSNRNTADSLYELVKNQTMTERAAWEAAFYTLICKAQEMYIDAGGTDITTYNKDFVVTLPLLDMANFLSKIQGYSLALADGIISKSDYRNEFPGINPLQTVKDLEAEDKAAQDKSGSMFGDKNKLNDMLNKMASMPEDQTNKPDAPKPGEE